jgi:cytochrome c556
MNSFIKSVSKGSLVAALLTVSSFTVAADMSEKQAKSAIEFRQSIFQLVKSNIGPLGAMAKGRIPMNEAVIETNALRMEQLSLMITDYFKADTRGAGVKSGALDKIWDDQAGFAQKTQDFTAASAALLSTVKAKDTANYKSAIAGVGKTCKACHDDYKAD